MTQSKRYEIAPKRLTFVQQHYTIMDGKDDISNVIREKKEPLTPRRAMRHLTGPLARLTARPTDTEDYIWATLTDPTPLPDAMAQLRAAYPNAMRLDYLPQGEVAHPLDMTQAVRGKPFVELFQDFFTKMNGRPLTVEETVAVKRLREEASKSE